MRIVLCAINSKFIHSNLAVHLLKAYALRFDAEKEKNIEIAEYTINNYAEDVLADLYLKKPDVIMFSCYIWNWEFTRSLFCDIHKVLPEAQIWVGGPEVSFDAEMTLKKYPDIKGVMIGEGEQTFKELALDHYFAQTAELKNIAGLCYRDENTIIRTKERALLSMDDVPFVYNDSNIAEFEHKIIYYESSRGCPFSCSYCLSSIDKSVRFRSLKKVYQELQFFLDHKVPQVKFIDRTFNVDHEHSIGILSYILEHDNGITNFHFEIAGDILTEEELNLMQQMRPGLIQLEIGVQSVNPDTIHAIHRVMNLPKLKKIVKNVNQMENIHQHLDLIAGLPYENYESFANSFNDVYAMEPEQLQLGFLKVLKGSPMEKAAGQYGIVYKKQAPYEVLFTNWISYDEILKLKKIEEMVELYYNSHQFSKTIKVLETNFSSPFEMYEQLSDFYEQNGFFLNSPSRIYRYQVLLEFALKTAPDQKELYQDLLTYDLYLRENCKSRPSFAADLQPYRETIRELKLDKQLHIDVFRHNIFSDDPEIIKKKNNGILMVSFDYQKRNPLDHNAYAVRIQ